MSRFLDRLPIVCACGNHAFAAVTRGFVTLVSVCDADLLASRKWSAAMGDDGNVYATGKIAIGSTRNVRLHRLIVSAKDGLEVDHANCDPLDNRRTNLRESSRSENARNRRLRVATTTGFRGVYPNRRGFAAHIRYDGRRHHLGTYPTAEEAYEAYCKAAAEHHGEFARLDNPPCRSTGADGATN